MLVDFLKYSLFSPLSAAQELSEDIIPSGYCTLLFLAIKPERSITIVSSINEYKVMSRFWNIDISPFFNNQCGFRCYLYVTAESF